MNQKKYAVIKTFLPFAIVFFFCRLQCAENPKRVLLAYENTPFKKALIDAISNELVQKGVVPVLFIHDAEKIKQINPDEYDAVLISNSGVKAEVRPWIREWLGKYRASINKVLLHTTQNNPWKVDQEVDSVTSASAPKQAVSLAKDYSSRIIAKLYPEKK